MIQYVVENTTEESVTVDGLGVLLPKETLEVSDEQFGMFEHLRGLKLTQAYMPEGVKLTVAITEEGK